MLQPVYQRSLWAWLARWRVSSIDTTKILDAAWTPKIGVWQGFIMPHPFHAYTYCPMSMWFDRGAKLNNCSGSMALSKQAQSHTGPFIIEKPQHPLSFKFPKHEFGKNIVNRSFQAQWFNRWTWLHYEETTDWVFCFTCIKAYLENKLHARGGPTSRSAIRNWWYRPKISVSNIGYIININ